MKASEISKISRNTKGVRIMRMRGEGEVVCVSVAPPEMSDEELDKLEAEHAEEYAKKDAADRENAESTAEEVVESDETADEE